MLKSIAGTALLLAITTGIVPAANPRAPHLFGSYTVLQATNIGRATQLELRVRLVNPNAQVVSVEKLTLVGVHPMLANALPAPVLLSAHGAQEMTQEFKLPTPEYQAWQQGLRPLLRVEMRTEKGGRVSQTVRLNGVPLQKEN
jgi:hypothetical protein